MTGALSRRRGGEQHRVGIDRWSTSATQTAALVDRHDARGPKLAKMR